MTRCLPSGSGRDAFVGSLPKSLEQINAASTTLNHQQQDTFHPTDRGGLWSCRILHPSNPTKRNLRKRKWNRRSHLPEAVFPNVTSGRDMAYGGVLQ